MFFPIKISDSNQDITRGSRADQYWHSSGMKAYYRHMRPGFEVPKRFAGENNLDQVIEDFHLRAVGFGNWVTLEDRLNYLNAMMIAFLDLNRVLRFKDNNIGIHKHLAVTFGARGRGRALAHYESRTEIINITRYKDSITDRPSSKASRFLSTGGIGSFAHEYGHFLDYFGGIYLDHDANTASLSGGDRTTTQRIEGKGELRFVMNELMEKIIWKVPGEHLSPYYKRLQKFLRTNHITSDYYVQRNEIFARAFEAYVKYELGRLKIKNYFLTDRTYSDSIYLNDKEMSKLVPTFRKLISDIRNRIS